MAVITTKYQQKKENHVIFHNTILGGTKFV